MDKNFKVRVIVGISIFVVAMVALYTFDSVPFKVLFGLFSTMAALELLSFFRRSHTMLNIVLAILELAFLVGGVYYVSQVNVDYFWYIILGVPGYDVFAYLFGKLFGGKVFGKSRPFPRVSKNKTWEGTILGLVMAVGLVAVKIAAGGRLETDWIYLLCGPLALCGDLFESYLKRTFKVKDSNEILIHNKFFAALETCVGGSKGHGGFLDRVDSTAFACSVLLLLVMII